MRKKKPEKEIKEPASRPISAEAEAVVAASHPINLVKEYADFGAISPITSFTYDDIPKGLLHPVSAGELTVDLPFSVKVDALPMLYMCYCIEGGIRYEQGGHTITVGAGEALLLDCNTPFTGTTVILPCIYRFCYIGGTGCDIYIPYIGDICAVKTPIDASSVLTLEQIIDCPKHIGHTMSLRVNMLLTEIVTRMCMYMAVDESGESAVNPLGSGHRNSDAVTDNFVAAQRTAIPSYLALMHSAIHRDFSRPHSLGEWENLYGISRYRLCREYKAAYGASPIQELNAVRIARAKELLLASSMRVQEIAAETGFYDVTHFIRLFKRDTGLTPGDYRARFA